MDLREIGWEDVEWMHLAEDTDQWRALLNTLMKNAANFLTSKVTISFSRSLLQASI
jgi:hypothetical protein